MWSRLKRFWKARQADQRSAQPIAAEAVRQPTANFDDEFLKSLGINDGPGSFTLAQLLGGATVGVLAGTAMADSRPQAQEAHRRQEEPEGSASRLVDASFDWSAADAVVSCTASDWATDLSRSD